MRKWTFGVGPLQQTKDVAARLRRITSLVLACEADEPAVAGLIAELERTEAALAQRVPTDTAPRIGDMVDGDGRVYLDHARDIGAYNPCFPDYDIGVDGERATGTVAFPIVYEGPPGIVHGGFLAVFFDCAVQHHNCDVGVAGKTTSLAIRYRRPAPLHRVLAFTIDRVAAGSRIRSTGQLFEGDRLLCEVDVDAIAGDRATLPDVSPRRSRERAVTSPVVDAGDGLPLTVPALLRVQATTRPHDTLLVCDDDTLTYTEADTRSAALAKALLATEVSARTRVAILHPNGSEFVVAWLAAARIGAISVPLSTFSTSTELVGLLRGADVAVLLAASSYRSHDYLASLLSGIPGLDLTAPAPLLTETAPSLRRIAFAVDDSRADSHADWTVGGLLVSGSRIGDDILVAAEDAVTPADPMVIVHTSGSTSEPKGVIHTHGALIRHLDNLNQLRRYEPDEILFSNSPFFWIGGFAYALLGTLLAGATLVCSNAPDAAGVLDVLERERPTMVNGFAASVGHLPQDPSFASRDLSSIRRGNLYPIMPDAVRPRDPDLRHGMLGMTEAGSVCLASEDEAEQPEERRGSFGRPVAGFEAEARRQEDGAICTSGEPGELWLRGPFLMDGYDGRERHDVFDDDGWYCTGDVVTVDGDGFFYFRGRSGDMIKTAGANVSPREVEAAILGTTGLASHVVGVDDATRGQVVAALVRSDGPVDVDDLRTQLEQRLSAYKVPRTIVVVPDEKVPMMSSGKIDLRALKELLGGA